MRGEIDRYQLLFLAGAGLLILVQTFRGWRLGVVRQLVNLAALVLAYGVAAAAGRLATPLVAHLRCPHLLVAALVGSVAGLVVYLAVSGLGAVLFRRTGEQRLGVLRLGYGAGGSVIGFLGGLAMVWLAVVAIRFIGTLAQAEVNLAAAASAHGRVPTDAGQMAVQFAHLKRSLDSGPTGAVFDSIDPVPERAYGIIGKIARVMSSAESINRFVAFPGARELTEHPKILALRSDPEILKRVQGRDFVSLLGNRNIVAAMNDPQLGRLVRSFELEKALDYALATTQKNVPAPARQTF